ncbi:neutral alpha-glucosidase C isoform X2 [Phyllopteryx taeniolatus]|uniref:neutral alpha-glucosidase C isoform X2 n=1 Tax=Phyllopteryx taeniolatus TaxID=161469 RepID=UPI002AD2ADD8|nr:neutral alpha-glucosidase C isoform X2 [Phyllopteryx taeniolatus]
MAGPPRRSHPDDSQAFVQLCLLTQNPLKRHPRGTYKVAGEGAAKGEVYLDDGHTFLYRDKREFCLRSFRMLAAHLRCRAAGEVGNYQCGAAVRSVDILGLRAEPSAVRVHAAGGAEGVSVEFEYDPEQRKLSIGNLELAVDDDWDIQIC